VNVLLLWSSPYSSPFWLTFKQALDLKGSVRKGEKGTPIVFYKQLPGRKDDRTATDEKKERIPFVLCYYTVFNVEQCDGLTLPPHPGPQSNCQGRIVIRKSAINHFPKLQFFIG
jgi:antirestriction protein ArdC